MIGKTRTCRTKLKKSKDKLDFKLGLVVDGDLTLEFLAAEAIEVPIEEGGPKAPCLLLGRQPPSHSIFRLPSSSPRLAPMHGNLRGPVTDGPLSNPDHACFPWRLLACYKWLELKSNKDGKDCISGECPSENPNPIPTPSVSAFAFRLQTLTTLPGSSRSVPIVRGKTEVLQGLMFSSLSYSIDVTSANGKRDGCHKRPRKTVMKGILVRSARW